VMCGSRQRAGTDIALHHHARPRTYPAIIGQLALAALTGITA
jgi:hypothetical protein